jgi:hypothetical protein
MGLFTRAKLAISAKHSCNMVTKRNDLLALKVINEAKSKGYVKHRTDLIHGALGDIEKPFPVARTLFSGSLRKILHCACGGTFELICKKAIARRQLFNQRLANSEEFETFLVNSGLSKSHICSQVEGQNQISHPFVEILFSPLGSYACDEKRKLNVKIRSDTRTRKPNLFSINFFGKNANLRPKKSDFGKF